MMEKCEHPHLKVHYQGGIFSYVQQGPIDPQKPGLHEVVTAIECADCGKSYRLLPTTVVKDTRSKLVCLRAMGRALKAGRWSANEAAELLEDFTNPLIAALAGEEPS